MQAFYKISIQRVPRIKEENSKEINWIYNKA